MDEPGHQELPHNDLHRKASDGAEMSESLRFILAQKSEQTLRARLWPLLQFEKWGQETNHPVFPVTERVVYLYLKGVLGSGRRAARATCICKALRFCGWALGFDGATEATRSQRVMGAAWTAQVRCRGPVGRGPFLVAQVKVLQHAACNFP